MRVIETGLEGVMVLEPAVLTDERGWFMEVWNAASFAHAGIEARFVQDNHSRSAKGVLRGLHYQLTRPQGKLIKVAAGRTFSVAVDLRRSSPSFSRWAGAELSAENKRLLWVPPGFAHGFLALEDGTELLYKCTDFYAPADERALRWSDPRIGIEWPLGGHEEPLLSPRDRAAPFLESAEEFP